MTPCGFQEKCPNTVELYTCHQLCIKGVTHLLGVSHFYRQWHASAVENAAHSHMPHLYSCVRVLDACSGRRDTQMEHEMKSWPLSHLLRYLCAGYAIDASCLHTVNHRPRRCQLDRVWLFYTDADIPAVASMPRQCIKPDRRNN